MSALPSTAVVAARRVPFELLSFSREVSSLIFNFGYPTIMYLIFVGSGVFSVEGRQMTDFGMNQYFLPGMLATGIVLATTQELGIRVVEERETSLLKRLRTTPTTATAYVLGKLGQVGVLAVTQAAILIAVATLGFGATLPETPEKWGIFAATFILGVACGAALGFGLAVLLPSARSANGVVVPTVLILQFFSGVFFPFNSLPSWMQTVAGVFPLRWLASGMRAAFFPDYMAEVEPGSSFDVGLGLGVLAIWTVVSIAIAVRFFRWVPHEQK